MSDRDRTLRSGERQVHEVINGIEFWHKERYKSAVPYCRGKSVLDAGCGCGYGSNMVSDVAKQVFAIDDSAEAIDFASQNWQAKNIIYECHDFLSMPAFDVDVIIAFEFIEHIEDTEAVFEKFKAFNPSTVIASVPHIRCPMGANKFHYRHYGMDDLIDRFFGIGLRPIEAKVVYYNQSLTNYIIAGRQ